MPPEAGLLPKNLRRLSVPNIQWGVNLCRRAHAEGLDCSFVIQLYWRKACKKRIVSQTSSFSKNIFQAIRIHP